MNRKLLDDVLYALEYASDMTKPEGLSGCDCPICTIIPAVKAELAKPEPEPVGWAHVGPLGYSFSHVQNKAFDVPLYAAPTEPNCKFPTCHSQEYQNKLVQEILGQEPEPYAWVFVPHNELLWPDEVEHKTPCKATGYIPLYTKGTP